MEVKAYIKNVKLSPKKLRFLLPEIKKLSPSLALDVLFYSPEKSSRILYKAIKSAVTNAQLLSGKDNTQLVFKQLAVEGARKLKRFRAGGRGMAKSIMRRYAHIKIILETANIKKEPQKELLIEKPKLKVKTQLKSNINKKV